jgi:hypothetical protein
MPRTIWQYTQRVEKLACRWIYRIWYKWKTGWWFPNKTKTYCCLH